MLRFAAVAQSISRTAGLKSDQFQITQLSDSLRMGFGSPLSTGQLLARQADMNVLLLGEADQFLERFLPPDAALFGSAEWRA